MTTQQEATLPLQTGRLRSSCNACGTAKVKCDRGQPQCRRCAAMNLVCVYGASHKTGKAPRKRLAYGKRITPTAMPTAINGTRDTSTLRPKPASYLGPPSSVQLTDLTMTDTPMPPAIADRVDDHSSLESSFFIPPCLSFSLENWDDLDLGLNLSPAVSAISAPEGSQDFSLATPSVSAKHDCPQESYEVFRDLTAAPSLSTDNADTILAQLDRVLQANRTAIDRLTSLLECSCPKPPYLAMLHSSIISRILGLYEQAAGCARTVPQGPAAAAAPIGPVRNLPPSSSSTPASTTAISTNSTNTYTGGISDDVTQLPFSLGRFNIEEPCVQLAFKNLLIGNELKRAGILIDLFASQSPGGGAEGLYSSLSAWLRAEHSSTIRILRSAIKELNEGIDL